MFYMMIFFFWISTREKRFKCRDRKISRSRETFLERSTRDLIFFDDAIDGFVDNDRNEWMSDDDLDASWTTTLWKFSSSFITWMTTELGQAATTGFIECESLFLHQHLHICMWTSSWTFFNVQLWQTSCPTTGTSFFLCITHNWTSNHFQLLLKKLCWRHGE